MNLEESAILRFFTEKNLSICLVGGIIIGCSLGIAAQLTKNEAIESLIGSIAIFGKIFLSMLKMVVVPLVLFSVTSGVANLGGGGEVGRKLLKTMVYFLSTMFLAVGIGIIYTNIVGPGRGVDPEAVLAQLPPEVVEQARAKRSGLNAPDSMAEFLDVQINNVFMNPFQALATTNLIGVVCFGLVLGLMILLGGQKTEPARLFFDAMFDALMRLVWVVIWFAPIGILALAADLLMQLGPDIIAPLSKYFLTVVFALLTHLFISYPLILLIVCRYSPLQFFLGIKEALLLAVTTSSSSATLPVTMRVVEEHLGVDKPSANFVLPMGATINMDGTALYEAVAAMFIAQLFFGADLTIMQQILVFFTATLAAIGAAGIPQAGLVTMAIVFNALGLPLELMALIIVVDRPLDHLRTVVNVSGDAIGSVFLSHSEGQLKRTAHRFP